MSAQDAAAMHLCRGACKQTLPESAFYASSVARSAYICKPCKRAQMNARTSSNPADKTLTPHLVATRHRLRTKIRAADASTAKAIFGSLSAIDGDTGRTSILIKIPDGVLAAAGRAAGGRLHMPLSAELGAILWPRLCDAALVSDAAQRAAAERATTAALLGAAAYARLLAALAPPAAPQPAAQADAPVESPAKRARVAAVGGD